MSGRAFFSVCRRNLRAAKCPDEGQRTESGPEITDQLSEAREVSALARHSGYAVQRGRVFSCRSQLIGGPIPLECGRSSQFSVIPSRRAAPAADRLITRAYA